MIKYLIILLISSNALIASNEAFNSANKYYQDGEFKKAIETYESILQSGLESSELYYNLANSYYKSSKIAKSIINYERALVLDPSNEDYKFNLEVARLKTIDKIEPLPKLFIFELWESFTNSMNSNYWSVIAIISSILSALFLVLFLYKKSNIFLLISLISFISIILFALSASSRVHYEKDGNFGIIMTNTSYVKSSPKEESTDLFILHEGSKCEVLDKVGDWIEVKIMDGNKGWIKSTTLEII